MKGDDKTLEQVLKDMKENSNTKLIAKMVDNDFSSSLNVCY